ncbi:MFS transporter [Paenibacillus arenilitoris]|uniref:MFS transporter n=1 Tax=Paenibacillus arenilitoris TaxID=2772299 RepID=A0A927CPR1_9BACL|nr:MFS transporter [Paenibacillus arenilitoris]MBD2870548.1 MFS transporter [Paenibacillus arenilitoris]
MTKAGGDAATDETRNWRLNLALLWAGNFLVTGSATMVIPFLPLYLEELGVPDGGGSGLWAGAIFAAHYVSLFVCQPIWGRLADRYGRKPMLLRASFGMAVVMAMMGFAATPLQLLLLRLLNGAFAGFSPSATAIVSTNTPPERIGMAMGTLHSGNIAGTVTGPLIGGLLAEWIGLRGVFSVTGAVMLLAAVGTALWVKDYRKPGAGGETDASSVLGGLRVLCRTKEIPALLAVSMMIQFALTGSLPFIPLFVKELHGDGELLALFVGLVSSVTGVSNMLFAPLLGRLSDRTDPRRVLLCSMGGACLVAVLHLAATAYWQLLALRFLLGLCIGGLIPTVRTLLKQYVPKGMETRAYSFDTSAVSLGSVLGPLLSGASFGWIGLRGVFLLTACLMLLNACWTWKRLGWPRSSPIGARGAAEQANKPI